MFIICAVVFCAIVGFVIYVIAEGFDGSAFASATCGALVGFLLGIIIAVIAAPCGYPDSSMEISQTTEYDIVSLEDNMGITTGTMYAMRASIDSELKYIFLYDNNEKGITSQTIPANHTYIRYIENGETPTVLAHKYTFISPVRQFLSLDACVYEYTLLVPEGTIAENSYNISLN